MSDVRIRAAGDAALVIELPARMDVASSARAVAIAKAIRNASPEPLLDVVVGYHTVTTYFDPEVADAGRLEAALAPIAASAAATPFDSGAHLDIPVCYGGECGPDLADVASALQLTEPEVIELHANREYRVFVIGFVPGFAYMGPLPEPLGRLGRRATPRTRVPVGSVAIAGGQTGIYPAETPGGWHILGRTPVRPFDASRTPPVLFAPGDRVRFRAIDRREFDQLTGT